MARLKKRRPTILDVAAAVGVSPATVSNAINRARPVEAETQARVLEAVRRLGYTPNHRARNLRSGRADTIAIFSSMPFAVAGGPARLGYLMEVAGAAAERALQNALALMLVPPFEHGRLPLGALHIDGALVVEPLDDDPEVRLLLERNIPVVSIGGASAASPIPAVDTQPFAATRVLLDHLDRQGARNIALIVGAQPRLVHRESERCYRQFQTARRRIATITRIDEPRGEEGGFEETVRLLRADTTIDALLVGVDAFAAGATRAAQALGRNVPNDLRIVTRYDGLLAREHDLTALNLHLPTLGALAVDLLIKRMAGRRTGRSVRAPVPLLVARRSSA